MAAEEPASTAHPRERGSGQEHPSEESFRTAHLESGPDREIRAARPRPDVESMRAAYLELLKLSLCDLTGASTLSVTKSGHGRQNDGPIFSRELAGAELGLRAKGVDWPWSGLTMVGLTRLDDLQRCIESVVAEDVDGDLIEAGAWRGGASILMRATLDSLGADERTVWVADSFRGLPPPDHERFPEDHELDLSRLDYLAVPVDEVRAYFARFGCEHGVRYLEGFFGDTLPTLRDHRWSVVRLDGDTYESTWVGLDSLYPGLSAGGHVIVDDYLLIDECRRAVDDYRREHQITEPIEEIDWNSVRWRREEVPRRGNGRRAEPAAPVTAGTRGARRRHGRARIPTERELELERQVAALRRGRWPMRWVRRATAKLRGDR
jgi:O-methyltransferase